MVICPHCHQEVHKRYNKYCSNKCQINYQYVKYIADWKHGLVKGTRGVETQGISKHIVRYLIENFGQACSLCSWSEINPTTGKVPLEIDHIDGDANNNYAENLRLICPNCHSLTPTFRNLNHGRGREWRRLKYLKQTITPP